MGKRAVCLSWIGVLLLFVLAACGMGPSPVVNTPVPTPAATLSVQVPETPGGPQVVAQEPLAGQRLDLSPVIQIVFDRDMDQAKTGRAFTLLGPDEAPVPGKAAW